MKPTRKKLIALATFSRPNGKEIFEKINLLEKEDLVRLNGLANSYYFKEIELPEGGLEKLLSYILTGKLEKQKQSFVPLPAPSDLNRWTEAILPLAELAKAFPGADTANVRIWRDSPGKKRKGVYSHTAPKGFEVAVVREEWEEAAQTIDKLRIRTRQKNRPIPISHLHEIASSFFGDRIFWFDIEQTNVKDPEDEDFHRYNFMSVASDKFSLVDLIAHGSVFQNLLRTLSSGNSNAKISNQ